MINTKVYSKHIKLALEKMNYDKENDCKYDYGDDYVLSDEVYILRQIDQEIYIERVNHTCEDEDEGFEKLQKIVCNDPKYFINLLELVIKS